MPKPTENQKPEKTLNIVEIIKKGENEKTKTAIYNFAVALNKVLRTNALNQKSSHWASLPDEEREFVTQTLIDLATSEKHTFRLIVEIPQFNAINQVFKSPVSLEANTVITVLETWDEIRKLYEVFGEKKPLAVKKNLKVEVDKL
jgi:hypothetical protein